MTPTAPPPAPTKIVSGSAAGVEPTAQPTSMSPTTEVGPLTQPTSIEPTPLPVAEQIDTTGQVTAATALSAQSTTTIPFITIAQQATLRGGPTGPFYTVVKAAQGDRLPGQLPARIAEAGLQAGQVNLIIVAVAGVKSSSGYSITIEKISQADQQLIIEVSQTEPEADDIVEPAATMPYHLAAVNAEALDPADVSCFTFQNVKGDILEQGEIAP